jgi:choline kinase
MKPTLLILAAGMGSRYGSLKQIDPIGPSGETIIDYSVFDAIRAGFGKVVFIIRKDIENDFREVFVEKLSKHIDIEYVFQELDMLPKGFVPPADRVKPWGTGHAVLMAENVINEPFAALNADDFYGAGAFEVMAAYLKSLTASSQTDYAMVGYDLGKTMSEYGSVSRGICRNNSDNWLEEITERTKISFTETGIADIQPGQELLVLDKNDVVSMNFWGFTPEYFRQTGDLFREFLANNINDPKSEFYIPLAVDTLIKQKKARIKVLHSHDQWFGVTYKEDKPLVVNNIKQLIHQGLYPEKLWK